MNGEYRLNKNQCNVKVFVSGKILFSKYFFSREKRNAWMLEKTEQLVGAKNIYFEITYYYKWYENKNRKD